MQENFQETLERIFQLIQEKKYALVRTELLQCNEADIGDILEEVVEELGAEKAVILFRLLPKDVSAVVFSYISSECQRNIVTGITVKEVQNVMEEMSFDDMIDVLEELPANVVDRILMQTDKETRKLINQFLNYPESSAGSLMTIDYIGLKREMTVEEALSYIKVHGMDRETIYTCYVMDAHRHLEGIVSLRTLVVSAGTEKISDLMHEDFISVAALDDREDVAQLFQKYDFLALPVVDKESRLVGIITFDDIMDVIEEENTEDFQKMAGMSAQKEEYLDMSVWAHIKARIPWLFVLMLSYIITGRIIAGFEATLSQVIALVAYMPMLMGTGGNSGSQSATLVIRGMSIGDIELRDVLKVFWKEVRIGCFIGIILSSVNFLRIVYFEHQPTGVALTVCGAMIVIVILAKTIGSMLPMAAKKIGLDPALMASPMISSLTDMISVLTYFALATMILGI